MGVVLLARGEANEGGKEKREREEKRSFFIHSFFTLKTCKLARKSVARIHTRAFDRRKKSGVAEERDDEEFLSSTNEKKKKRFFVFFSRCLGAQIPQTQAKRESRKKDLNLSLTAASLFLFS